MYSIQTSDGKHNDYMLTVHQAISAYWVLRLQHAYNANQIEINDHNGCEHTLMECAA